MPNLTLRCAVIVGSVREGRFGPTAARWFARTAAEPGRFEVDVIDIGDHPLLALPGPVAKPTAEVAAALAEVTPRLAAADVFVVVTPEYNHSFPAALKSLIDWHFEQWQAKPVGYVSYGGRSGGLRAVEHLRQVFSELHAVSVRDTVSFHGGSSVFTDDGEPRDGAGARAAAKGMLDQLEWWGTALREAREKRPYLG
ncbi:NAD(P)H-dependent oxidoreductase [Streptantibioticus parmotrematis]|uniref:NADPH-dependent FMN reductase n=1 Tax=Streptantibioticus parmotrematis TaxID=2873249 RepID=UPI0033CF1C3D